MQCARSLSASVLRYRVAALLEVYVKRVPDSLHLPAMVSPLLQALDRAGKPSGSQTLAQRLQVQNLNPKTSNLRTGN